MGVRCKTREGALAGIWPGSILKDWLLGALAADLPIGLEIDQGPECIVAIISHIEWKAWWRVNRLSASLLQSARSLDESPDKFVIRRARANDPARR
jgi:hypothetical protein